MVVQAFDQDAPRTPPMGRCFRHVHPFLSDGLGQFRIAPEELVEVTAERSDWASLLPLPPAP